MCTLRELAVTSGLRIDASQGVVYSMKIIGRVSDNGRTYPADVLLEALPLYEGVKVFVDHSEPRGKRSYADVLGQLRNVRFRGGALFGDVHLNLKHPLTERLLHDAQHFPNHQIGLSHDASGEISAGGIVKRIDRVFSVDLVAYPATTKTLHESTGDSLFDFSNFSEAIREGDDFAVPSGPVLSGPEAFRRARGKCEQRAEQFFERQRQAEHPADGAARQAEESQSGSFSFDNFAGSIREPNSL